MTHDHAEDPGATDTGCIAAQLRAAGCVLVHNLIPRDLASRLADAIDAASEREIKQLGEGFLEGIGQRGYVSDFLAIGPEVVELLESPSLVEILEAVFGEEPRLFAAQGIILAPGEGRGVWPRRWHADMFQVAKHFDSRFTFALNCLVFLDDVETANGATVAIEGSHRAKHLIFDDDLLNARTLTANASKGSAMLLDGGVWHAAGFNYSPKPRRAMKLMFSRRWVRPEIDYQACGPRIPISGWVRRLIDVNI